jgi:hypothetical protein
MKLYQRHSLIFYYSPSTVLWALLLPKLRSQLAEFLNEGSLERLRILSSSTCVGLWYGHLKNSLEVFLASVSASNSLRINGNIYHSSELTAARIFLNSLPQSFDPANHSGAGLAFLGHPIGNNAS